MKNVLFLVCLTISSLCKAERLYLKISDNECHKTVQVDRFFETSKHNVDVIVRTFYKASTYIKDSALKTPAIGLLEFFKGHEIHDGILTLKYSKKAETILNSNACEQAVNRIPLEQMLLKYPGVKEVIYQIDGKLVNGFDA